MNVQQTEERKSTQNMLYDHVRSSARLLDEVWNAIDGIDCEACDGEGWITSSERFVVKCADHTTEEFSREEAEQELRNGYSRCDNTHEIVAAEDMCEVCDGEGKITLYEGSDAREYLEEMPLEIVWEKGEPFAVVLGTGGPHIEIRGGTRHDGMGYQIHGYWAGEHSTWSGEGVTRTGEYFREQVEESDEANTPDPYAKYDKYSRY